MNATESPAAQLADADEDELSDLLFGVRRSIRYHNHRRRFFDSLDKFTKILSAVAGSATIAAALGQSSFWTISLAAFVAIFSAINLVIGAGQAARLHSDLAKRFAALERDMVLSNAATKDQLSKFVAERLMIEAEEPPIMRVLDSQCYNELCKALGYDDCHSVKVDPVQALFSQIVDLWPSKIKKSSAPVGTPTTRR